MDMSLLSVADQQTIDGPKHPKRRPESNHLGARIQFLLFYCPFTPQKRNVTTIHAQKGTENFIGVLPKSWWGSPDPRGALAIFHWSIHHFDRATLFVLQFYNHISRFCMGVI